MATPQYAVNGNIFFIVHDASLVVWNYVDHEQYELSLDHLRAIIDVAYRDSQPTLVDDLIETGILLQNKLGSATNLSESDVAPLWGWDVLSKVFHFGTSAELTGELNSDPFDQSAHYVEYCESILGTMPTDAFALRRGDACGVYDSSSTSELTRRSALLDTLERRTTSRRFTGGEISLSNLRYIMDATFGYRDHDMARLHGAGLDTPARRRTSPSGGSLQCCEAYLISRCVEGLSAGVYHYWSDCRSLGYLSELPPEFNFGKLFSGQMFAEDLSAAIIITSRFDKMWWKYKHSRAYRVALMDAGHLSQTAQLLATEVNLRTWLTGMFFDVDLRRFLCISDNTPEHPLLVIGLGTGTADPIDKFQPGVDRA